MPIVRNGGNTTATSFPSRPKTLLFGTCVAAHCGCPHYFSHRTTAALTRASLFSLIENQLALANRKCFCLSFRT